MEEREILLAQIADCLATDRFIIEKNGELKARLRCSGLGDYYDKYYNLLEPHSYNHYNGRVYENPNQEYNVFLALDFILSELFQESNNEAIIGLLTELVKSFNVRYIEIHLLDVFEELSRLYEILGLSISIKYDEVKISAFLGTNNDRIDKMFFIEKWLSDEHRDVYDSYKSAITAYKASQAGACIESCRTAIVSMFSKFKGTEDFAKWLRGISNVTGESEGADLQELNNAIKGDLKKAELAEFFKENKDGKFTKTKTIYMLYSMMSDYGTHRNEGIIEVPTESDALFVLRITDSILLWLYQITN